VEAHRGGQDRRGISAHHPIVSQGIRFTQHGPISPLPRTGRRVTLPGFPEQLVLVFKTFALAALDHPYPPLLAIERRSQRMAVDTVTMTVRD
jgi:hypothetical protein